MAFPRLLSLPTNVIGLAYLVAYVALDWLSFISPYGPFAITPWNPSVGLSMVLILLFGQRHVPMLVLAPLFGDILVRGVPAPLPILALTAAIIGGGYGAAAMFLTRPRLRFDVSLATMRDLALFLAIACIASAAVAVTFVGTIVVFGYLPVAEFGAAALRYWVGDLIGIAVLAPFLLITLTRERPFVPSWEAGLQVAAILLGLIIAFGLAYRRELPLFYLLFLPVVWIAVRSGLEGVSAGLVITQIGLIVALQLVSHTDADVTSFQALMLVLTMTGLATGALVTERRRMELQYRMQQDAQARLSRLGSMGEFASMLAHEINQPLMAAGTYTRLAARMISTGAAPEKAADAAGKAVGQVERAAEVVRRLRDLIRLGRSELAPVSIPRIVDTTLELMRPDIERSGVRVTRSLQPALPLVMADELQVQQVLINLVRNGIEAIREAGRERGTVTIEARHGQPGFVEISVSDNGRGFPKTSTGHVSPLNSTKPDGLGVGLALSRSIVQAHGGALGIGQTELGGARVFFTLPAVEERA